jgi:sigma-E factor negative regulatory protein RseB
MLYSDGLASFSVFVESADPHHQSFEGPSRVGAFSAYGAIVVGHQVTVVGEVPPITVERVARTLRSER